MHQDIEIIEIRTTEQSKPLMIERLKLYLEQTKFIFPSKSPLKDELLVYRRQGKKMGSVSGKHDDTVMGSATGLATIEECESTIVFGNIPTF
jgi:hypothetical protein